MQCAAYLHKAHNIKCYLVCILTKPSAAVLSHIQTPRHIHTLSTSLWVLNMYGPVQWCKEREIRTSFPYLLQSNKWLKHKQAANKLSSVMNFWAAQVGFFQYQFGGVWLSVCPNLTVHSTSFFGPKIFVRLPLWMNNWMHFHGIAHELKIKDKTRLLAHLTPAAQTQFTPNSCDTFGPWGLSSVLWQHYHWVTLC